MREKVYPWRDELEPNKRVCVEWTPRGSRVLEFGCATGFVSRALRDERGCRVTGFEFSPVAAEQARRYCERVIVGDIEDPDRWRELVPPYDVALFGDVLEHLRDPEAVLERCRGLISREGLLIVSIPNVAHYSVRLALLAGRFDYTEFGILDNTHLRFFTRETLRAMLARTGFTIEELRFSTQRSRSDRVCERLGLGALKRALNRAADALFPTAAAFQWLARCRPAAGEPDAAAPGGSDG